MIEESIQFVNTIANIILHKIPEAGSKGLETVSAGGAVTIIDHEKQWFEVESDKETGYVKKNYLRHESNLQINLLMVGFPHDLQKMLITGLENVYHLAEIRTCRNLSEAGAILRKEGYRYSLLLTKMELDSFDDFNEFIRILQNDYPWIDYITESMDDESSKHTKMYSEMGKDASDLMKLEATISKINNKITSLLDSKWKPPFFVGDTSFLAEKNDILFSLSLTNKPWLLESEAMLMPVQTGGSLYDLAKRCLKNMDEKDAEKVRKEILTKSAPSNTERFHVINLGNWQSMESASATLNLVSTPLDFSKPDDDRDDAYISYIDTCHAVASQNNFRTMVMPLEFTSKPGPPDIGKHVNGMMNKLNKDKDLDGLKHVVFTVENESSIDLVLRGTTSYREKESTSIGELKNDIPSGPDRLNVENEVFALADAITLKDLSPPLVVGILGGWGAGKSFALHLLQKRIEEIRSVDLTRPENKDFHYVGHPYVIKFDAWTYAKSNLWASLMHTIFSELNRQLNIEVLIAKGKDKNEKETKLKKGGKVWSVLNAMSKSELDRFETDIGKQAIAEIQNLNADKITGDVLWRHLGKIKNKEIIILEDTKKKKRRVVKALKKRLEDNSKQLTADIADKINEINSASMGQINIAHESFYNQKIVMQNELVNLQNNRKIAEFEAMAELKSAITAIENDEETSLLRKQEQILKKTEHKAEQLVENKLKIQARERAWKYMEFGMGELGASIRDKFYERVEDQNENEGNPEKQAQGLNTLEDFNSLVESVPEWIKFVSGMKSNKNTFIFFALIILGVCIPFFISQIVGTADKIIEWVLVGGLTSMLATVGGIVSSLNIANKKLQQWRTDYETILSEAQENPEESRAQLLEEKKFEKIDNNAITDLKNQIFKLQASYKLKIDITKIEYDESLLNKKTTIDKQIETANNNLAKVQNNLDNKIEEIRIHNLEKIKKEKKLLREEAAILEKEIRNTKQQKIDELVTKIEEQQQRIGITGRYKSLKEFVLRRLNSSYYDAHLGLMHQVKKDLDELSEALIHTEAYSDTAELSEEMQNEEMLFPRNSPRIVLIIDDLDRCPPEIVVQVLEATQLLVKTPLFVVVLAMDARYITRSLEKAYEGILVRDGEPSGLDYIEKIVQIPYNVPGIDSSAVRKFLEAQVEMETAVSKESMKSENNQDSDAGEKDQKDKTVAEVPTAALPFCAEINGEKSTPIPRKTLEFKSEEINLLSECCTAVNVNPRAAKRLANIYKLLKIIWYRRNIHSGVPEEIQKAMLMLLAISGQHPEIMRGVLRHLETIAQEKTNEADRKLCEILIKQICAQEGPRAEERDLIISILEEGNHFSEDITLADLDYDNTRLVLSFSFVGEFGIPDPINDNSPFNNNRINN